MTVMTQLQKEFTRRLEGICVLLNEPLSRHTSFRIGGAAEVFALPKSTEELSRILKESALLDIKPCILGAGTNVLAPDEGLPGLVICLKDALDGMEKTGPAAIRVMAGVTMTRAAIFAANLGLSGLEFAHGIPGTVGGGVYMNAGAYGGEICQVCTQVQVMDMAGELTVKSREEMGFSYRHSCLEEEGGIVVSCDFALCPAPVEQIKATMQELSVKRKTSQPLELPSAGSAFKRPVGGYAAALIDQAGLKGFRIGDAAISEKHAGFAVNLGKATAADVKRLLAEVSSRVFAASGIRLEPEVRIW